MSAWCGWVALGLLLTGCEVGDQYFTFAFHQQNGSADAGRPNRPPEFQVVVVAPLQTGIGSSISLSARAVDPDGETVTYHWTGTGGQIKEPHAAETTYVCKDKGPHAVVVIARDSDGGASVSVIDVTCV